MNTLNPPPVDLISTPRTAPKNGTNSSQDYNDTMREILADLGSLAETLNAVVLPVLGTLPAEASNGLRGDTVIAKEDADNPLFYSATAERYYTVSEVCQNLGTQTTALKESVKDLTGRILSLQSKLATSNQNDIIQAVQGFADQMHSLSYQLQQVTQIAENAAAKAGSLRTARVDLALVAAEQDTVQVTWVPEFRDNAYTVNLSVEDAAGFVVINSWSKLPNGTGIEIAVENTAVGAAATAVLHCLAKAD